MSSFSEKILGNKKYTGIFRDILMYGKYYLKTRNSLRQFETLSRESIEEYQLQTMQKLVRYAYEHVPYYRELFDQISFKPEKLKHLEDIQAIPYLTKALVRQNKQKLCSEETPSKHLKLVTTGGTTGSAPLEFYLDRRSSTPVEFAYLQYIWARTGYRFGDKCVVLRGDTFGNSDDKPQYWKLNYLMNWLVMSSRYLTQDTAPQYIDRIREYNPRFIIIYPSSAYLLARHMKAHHIMPLKGLKGIICSSETLYSWQRQFISEVFGAPVFSYYGLSEKCCLASQCQESYKYEFLPGYGFVEIIDRSGKWCRNKGETGEIVATGFNNFTTPFIRYKTEDLCVFSQDSCQRHEGWTTVTEITGRISEFLVDSNNGLVNFIASDEVFWPILDKVIAYQYEQDTPGVLNIRLQVREALTTAEYKNLNEMIKKYYPGFEFSVSDSGQIPRTRSGKFRYLIQHIPIDFYSNE